MTLEGWLRCMVCLRVMAEGKGGGRGESGALFQFLWASDFPRRREAEWLNSSADRKSVV
jgi:hypothetical protein